MLTRLERTQERLNAYYDAELAVLSGQSYRIGSREMTRADLGVIRQTISDLENQIDELQSIKDGRERRAAFRIIPRDL